MDFSLAKKTVYMLFGDDGWEPDVYFKTEAQAKKYAKAYGRMFGDHTILTTQISEAEYEYYFAHVA